MLDAYAHLDMSLEHPLEALETCMKAAGVTRAFLIETWSGDNRPCLDQVVAFPTPQFRVALCFRPEKERFRSIFFEDEAIGGIRIRTADLEAFRPGAGALEASRKWLIPHAESGIGTLTNELLALTREFPQLRIFLPHMGWPCRDGKQDEEWNRSVSEMSALPNIVAGVSAIAHFSNAAFPHEDVRPYATRLGELFAPEALVAASDYPLFERGKYADYMKLANEWIGADIAKPGLLESSLFDNAEVADQR